jgi:hypothetical protein
MSLTSSGRDLVRYHDGSWITHPQIMVLVFNCKTIVIYYALAKTGCTWQHGMDSMEKLSTEN